MADFYKSYSITCANEGGYANDKDDAGGETYKGIARRYHPSWEGWAVIDLLKTKPNFPKTAYAHEPLNKAVKIFYKTNFWDVNLLDEFTSQSVANEMFDTGVNMGVARAGKFLQKALNLLNKNGQVWDDVVEDGKIGSNTIKALNACLAYRGDEYLYKILNILQGNHYIEYMTKSPTQERFAYGWLSRVTFLKD